MAEMIKIDLEDLLDGGAKVLALKRCVNCPFLSMEDICRFKRMTGSGEMKLAMGTRVSYPSTTPIPPWCSLRDRAVIVVVDA